MGPVNNIFPRVPVEKNTYTSVNDISLKILMVSEYKRLQLPPIIYSLKSGARESSYAVTNRVIRLLMIYSSIDTHGSLHKSSH